MTGARIDRILLCLTSDKADSGWIEFLDCYSPRLREIVKQYETDADLAKDCFDFICAKLSDDGFRRLTAFKPDGPARFTSWLTAVAANLCIDWRRMEYGRFRAPNCIHELPELDQMVFDCYYRLGMTRQECLQVLKTQLPRINARQLAEANARIHAALTSRQRWQLGAKTMDAISLDELSVPLINEELGPQQLVQSGQERECLEKAMACLEPQQRLLLQFRYQQDLTLEEVARLTGLGDAFRARRKIDAALAALAKAMKS